MKSAREKDKEYLTKCLFCEIQGGVLHTIQTSELSEKIKMFATDLQDNVLLPKVVIGDLVALEVKYHNACLTRLKNRHRSFSSQTNSVNKKQRAQ